MDEQIKSGDRVQLKSGGPTMTVTSVAERSGRRIAWCAWFDDKMHKQEHVFPVEAVRKIAD